MSEPLPIRAVVFDLDGLMFNTEELYDQVGARLLEKRGKQFTRELKDAMTGRPAKVALQIMIDMHALEATVEQLQAETAEIFPDILSADLEPLPGLHELIDSLEAAAVPKAIATSSRRSFLDTVLRLAGLESRWQFLLTSESVTEGKPDPEIYTTAAANFQVLPAQMMVLEDSEIGCRAAVAARAFTVAVPGDHSRHHNFADVQFVAEGLHDRRIYEALDLESLC